MLTDATCRAWVNGSQVTRATGGLEFSNNSSGYVTSVKVEEVDETLGRHIHNTEGAVELVLDAEVVQLVEHTTSASRTHSWSRSSKASSGGFSISMQLAVWSMACA